MNYKIFLILLSALIIPIFAQSIVKVHMHDGPYYENIKIALSALNIPFEKVQSLDKNDQENLYIIENIEDVDEETLPQYYAAYQTEDLKGIPPTQDLLNKFSTAIAVWDISWPSINTYKQQIAHYYYFPLNYEYSNPVVLPCMLPTDALKTYKELLTYSNTFDGDISSHLPALFVYGMSKQPKLILELGVRAGQSSTSFAKVAEHMGTQLIGVDIDCSSTYTYEKFKYVNAKFVCMDDRIFASELRSNKEYDGKQFDIIYIDTSHYYEHTLQEITLYIPFLAKHGALIFHDSNVTPLKNGTCYARINNTFGCAPGNTRGVTQAIKEYFKIDFNEDAYYKSIISRNGSALKIIHYPFCNGLTIIEKQ